MNDRARAERWGVHAESLAALWLGIKGFRILARRFRTPVGEIDLIAARGSTLAIVEVKARVHYVDALASIGSTKRRRVERATESFLSAHPEWSKFSPRFDVMVVSPWRLPRHLKDAWRPDRP